jgi:Mg-chelatase subunit ChlD
VTPAALANRPVDLVIALDTSGSMSGLIDSTRAQIWDIVNEMMRAKPTPNLRVGLVTFGSPDAAGAGAGFVKRRTALTTDLDSFYGTLMGLSTAGGEEYVGWALDTTLDTMDWSSDRGAVHLVFVAGNESADQNPGRHDYRTATGRAQEKGVVVNTIFAGEHRQGIELMWGDVAKRGGGSYIAIDMNRSVAAIATPYDDQLVQLNNSLNDTYIAYGRHGASGKANQVAQDANSSRFGSLSSRGSTKASAAYRNSSWDLVDARKHEGVDLAALPDAALPEPMRGMTGAERQAYIDGIEAERARVQAAVQDITQQRSTWLATERAKQSGQAGLDDAVRGTVVKQMTEAGFVF